MSCSLHLYCIFIFRRRGRRRVRYCTTVCIEMGSGSVSGLFDSGSIAGKPHIFLLDSLGDLPLSVTSVSDRMCLCSLLLLLLLMIHASESM